MSNDDVVIVGGGLAGLCCARHLTRSGCKCLILEASDQVGGRVQTDNIDGFLCDRGFQVLLTAYPEAKSVLDYEKLQLARFEPGAMIRFRGKFHRFADPWRRPKYLLSTALSPLATLGDKLRVWQLRRDVCKKQSLEALYERPEQKTIDKLREKGFSQTIIDRFFRPFMGGIFLERELTTSSRKFDFVFRMFSMGDAALPEFGMGTIAKQLAEELPPGTVRTGTSAASVSAGSVKLASGEELPARAVVVAADAAGAERLLGAKSSTPWNGVTCMYFAADKPPVEEPILVLNGDGAGPVNNLCVPSQVSSHYAPAGQALISVSVLDADRNDQHDGLTEQVLQQLREWFGTEVDGWRHLKSYSIPYALPDQSPPALSPVVKPVRRDDGIIVCGDHMHTASLQGAMVSGRLAAEAVMAS